MFRRDRAARLADVGGIALRPARAKIERGDGAVLAAGHDLCFLPEFAERLNPRFIERAYTAGEAAYCEDAADPVPYFGARWAAKEATYKAISQLATRLRAPLTGLATFRDYEVVHEDGSAVPRLQLHGRPLAFLEEVSRERDVTLSLSLTHERDYAAAFVVIAAVPPVAAREETGR
jgi:phosphopantetheine--protein transferase-like protein